MPSTTNTATVSAASKLSTSSSGSANQMDGSSHGPNRSNGLGQVGISNGLQSSQHAETAAASYMSKTQQNDGKSASSLSLGIHEHSVSTDHFVTALESYLRIPQQTGVPSPLRNYAADTRAGGSSLALPRLSTAASIAAELGGLDVNLVYHIAEFAYNDFTRTVGPLMQFHRTAVTCTVHDAYETALADIIRAQLNRKVPDYATKGYLALFSGDGGSVARLPRVYISETSMWKHTYRHLCQETGLPEASFETIPAVKGRMNVFALQAIIEKDQRSNNIPLVIVAVAGNNETGASDPLPKCLDIGRRYNVWLHAEGMSIPMMCLLPPIISAGQSSSSNTASMVIAKIADSITVDFAHWLGKFGLPKVTFIDTAKDASAAASHGGQMLDQSFFYQRHAGQKIRLLPLWTLLCLEGTDLLYKRSRSILELAFKLQKCILSIKTCRLLSPVKFGGGGGGGGGGASSSLTAQTSVSSPGPILSANAMIPASPSTTAGTSLAALSFDDVLAKASTGNVLLELLNPLVVFRFQMPPMEEREELIDALNVWLCTMLNREGVIGCDATTVAMQGVCLHFSPYDSLRSKAQYSNTDVNFFIDRLTNFVSILQYTFINRSYFRQLADGSGKSGGKNGGGGDSGCLQYVPVPFWPGLGAVRYIPKLWRSISTFGAPAAADGDRQEVDGGDLSGGAGGSGDYYAAGGGGDSSGGSIPETARPELNKFNQLLLDKLKERDTAYSKGEDAGTGLVFIRFGMVDETTRIEDLISNVRREGMKLEESREFHDSVADLVRKGIAAAQQDLKRESEDKLREEGLLRQVPVFGSFVNWWYPVPKSFGVISGGGGSGGGGGAGNPQAAATTSTINGRSFNLAAGTMEKIQFISSKSIVDYAAAAGNPMGVHEHVVVSRQVSAMPSSIIMSASEKKAAATAAGDSRSSGSSSALTAATTSDSSMRSSNSPLPQTGPDDVQFDPRRRASYVSTTSSTASGTNHHHAPPVATVQWPGSVKKTEPR